MSGGFSKEIDHGAMGLVFDTLQRFQYQYPIKSTIREVVSNGLDSVREKNVAISILKGLSKVEDHYVNKEGAIYKDSHFNADYYNLTALSSKDDVEVIYCDGGETGKDSLIIRDYGVGLGGDRLKGYFKLGYSTKRLNKFALGKFGLGAKSPLSTGIPYYTVKSRHNKMEFVFNIYNHRVESIVPKFDMKTGAENPEYTFPEVRDAAGQLISAAVTVHYYVTDQPNMFEIEMQVKKHHKQSYLDAVTSQLLYFPNVKLFEEKSNGYMQEIPVKAQIMFENNLIVLSNNSPYNKPHLILNGVNYGYIDFRELELEEKIGNIGIKVEPERVTINPSRESLVWDQTTREVIIEKFHEVVGIAETIINDEMQEMDFVKWMKLAATANDGQYSWNKKADNTILGRLTKIVDMSKIELSYPADQSFKFNRNLLNGIFAERVSSETTRKGSKRITKIEYTPGWGSSLQNDLPVVLIHGPKSNRKNKYMMKHLYPQGFLLVKLEVWNVNGDEVLPEDIKDEKMIDQLIGRNCGPEKAKARIAALHNFIRTSTATIDYDSINVPSDFKATETEEDEEETEEATSEEASISAAERRKLNGSTVVHTPRLSGDFRKPLDMQKVEVPVCLVDEWTNAEVFWSNQDYEELMHTAALMTRPYESETQRNATSEVEYDRFIATGNDGVYNHQFGSLAWFQESSNVRLIKVAQNNVKYYQDFKHITKFFKEIRNKTITMSNALVRWNTARMMQEKITNLAFLAGFKSINPEIHQKYKSVKNYIEANWKPMNISNKTFGADESTTGQLIAHLDKVGQFQLFVRQNADEKELIAELATQLFNPQPGVEIEDGLAIDTEVYDTYMQLIDWSEPVQVMLNMVSPLVDAEDEDDEDNKGLNQEQEEAIRHYFQYRSCPI